MERLSCADGVELHGDDGTAFALVRLREGVLLASIRGDDRGRLGVAPFVELERELARAAPAELFLDLRHAAGATAPVRDAWTGWFQRRRPLLKRVTVLPGSRFVSLTLEIAKLLSRTGELIQILSDQRLFEQALALATGAPVQLSGPPVAISTASPAARSVAPSRREVLDDRRVRLVSDGCTWLFERLRPAVLLATVVGHDRGEFGDGTLDEVAAALGPTPLLLFIDARRSPSASPAASEPWTAWLAAHRPALAQVLILTSARALRLTLEIARHRSGSDELIRVIDDEAAFVAAVAARVPGFTLPE